MADVAEEGGLGPVEFGQRFGSLLLSFIGLGVEDGSADVACDQLEKHPVGVIEDAARAHAEHGKVGEALVSRPQNGEHDRVG